MRMIDLIEKKRDGKPLSTAEIEWFIRAYTADEVVDYQVAALLMAIYIRGMDRRETVDLTLAMAHSGDERDLHDVAPFVIDKHSSGGVGRLPTPTRAASTRIRAGSHCPRLTSPRSRT